MNRPNKNKYINKEFDGAYVIELEKYCDELENKFKSLIELRKNEMGCDLCLCSSSCSEGEYTGLLELWFKEMEEVLKDD